MGDICLRKYLRTKSRVIDKSMIYSLFFNVQPVTEVLVFIVPRPVPGDTLEFSALYAVPVLIVIVTPVNISVITYDSQNMPKVTLRVLQSI